MNNTGYGKALFTSLAALLVGHAVAQEPAAYVPTQENIEARQEFADSKLGIFIHWGIYSMFAQGEWYMTNANLDRHEYAKAASAFYPIRFDAQELHLPLQGRVKKAFVYDTKQPLKMQRTKEGVTLFFDEVPTGTDYIVELVF